MATVEVKLYGNLRKYRPKSAGGAPHHPFSVELVPMAQTVSDLMVALDIPSGLTAVISINKETATLETVLEPNAKVSLFPPTAGGSS
ncbi:MAG: MoaD/ThiS family protein [Chloroflexota bacterium]